MKNPQVKHEKSMSKAWQNNLGFNLLKVKIGQTMYKLQSKHNNTMSNTMTYCGE